MSLSEIQVPSVCIVAMKSQCDAKEIMPGMHLPYYQVTIDPRQATGGNNGYSPTKEFMRFGFAKGDELNGWIPTHEVEIFEVLAEVESDFEIYGIETGRSLEDKSYNELTQIWEDCGVAHKEITARG